MSTTPVSVSDAPMPIPAPALTDNLSAAPEWHRYCEPHAWHPAASLYPMLDDADLIVMAQNIKDVGLLNPVVLLDGKVLDGRNRLEACRRANIEPVFTDYASDISPVEWVLSQNSQRRQLTPSQKAVVALEAEKLLAAEAKERQRMGKEKIPDPEKRGQARDKAAKLVGVNERYVTDAKKIRQKAPKLLAKISKGELTIGAALKKLPKDEKPSGTVRGIEVPPFKVGAQVILKARPELGTMTVTNTHRSTHMKVPYWVVTVTARYQDHVLELATPPSEGAEHTTNT